MWGDGPATWDGTPLRVDPDEWDAMEREWLAVCAAIGGIVPDRSVIEIYKDRSGTAWRWRALAANGEVISDSAEGYSRRWAARRAARRFLPGWRLVNIKN